MREWRRLRRVCPGRGKPALAELPEGVSLSAFGPRLHAHVAVLAGVGRLSREKIVELLGECYGIESPAPHDRQGPAVQVRAAPRDRVGAQRHQRRAEVRRRPCVCGGRGAGGTYDRQADRGGARQRLPVEEPTGSMVLDIGVGTTELALISMGAIVASRLIPIGGHEFDERIVTHLKREHMVLVGRQTAEQIKIQIGSVPSYGQDAQIDALGRDMAAQMPTTVRLTSQEIRGALVRPLTQIIEATREILTRTPPQLACDVMDRGITPHRRQLAPTRGRRAASSRDGHARAPGRLPVHLRRDRLKPIGREANDTVPIVRPAHGRHHDRRGSELTPQLKRATQRGRGMSIPYAQAGSAPAARTAITR